MTISLDSLSDIIASLQSLEVHLNYLITLTGKYLTHSSRDLIILYSQEWNCRTKHDNIGRTQRTSLLSYLLNIQYDLVGNLSNSSFNLSKSG
ncbi:hypothetical protein EVA_16753 [gut metagenome]|uniref:Uncharacterized protein n=1 Tax=gut metagenome TaxID=749906 RepID=J9FJS0_9ZZZZ